MVTMGVGIVLMSVCQGIVVVRMAVSRSGCHRIGMIVLMMSIMGVFVLMVERRMSM